MRLEGHSRPLKTTGTPGRRLTDRLGSEGVALLPATVMVAVVIAWALTNGGYESQPTLATSYEPNSWYLGALALAGLLVATAAGVRRISLSLATKLACFALAGYTAWSFLSMLWADDQGAAFLGSDRTLIYLVAFVTFAILPWSVWSARIVLIELIGGVGVLALITAVKVGALPDPSGLYLGARLVYPLGYYNAEPALFMAGALGAIALSARRSGPVLLRVTGLVLGAVCLQVAALSQSRGWLFSVPLLIALTLLLVPNRVRLLLFALAPAAATAAVAPALLRVYAKAAPHGAPLSGPRLGVTLHTQGAHATRAMLIADLALALVATAMVALDRRASPSAAIRSAANRVVAGLALLAALAGLTAGLVAIHGDVSGRAEHAWRSFADSGNANGGYSHFATLATNRADIWRVALRDFSSHPLTGVGQDNFLESYIRLRHADEQPRWTHSIELRLLAHTGLVGALLFAVFLVAALFAALAGRRGGERATAAIALLWLAVWLVQGSVEWFWEYPVLSVPAFALTAMAGSFGRPAAQRPGRVLRLPGVAWAALLGVCALAALAVPFVAAREIRAATLLWPSAPARAYDELRSASDLMPFDAQIYLLGGSIALNSAEYDRAHRWFIEAERHDHQNWIAPFALGMIESENVRLAAARTQLQRSRALNPRGAVIGQALARLRQRHPLTFAEAQALLTPRIVSSQT
jgi:O-antigen ligase/polysaccharide polymerase Wzy-like membrane protein